jgi:hypothetical protein
MCKIVKDKNKKKTKFQLKKKKNKYRIALAKSGPRCDAMNRPCILVSDILWQYEEPQSPIMSHQLLRRTEAVPGNLFSALLKTSYGLLKLSQSL